MSQEHDILQIIAENPGIKQRKIAEKAGISLGQVNFLIKKCVKKGWLKIEGQSPKSLKYNLTPKGLKEKAELTLKYIRLSYAAVIKIADKVAETAKTYKENGTKIYILDLKDEMTEVVKIGLDKAGVRFEAIGSAAEINRDTQYVLFVWDESESSDPEIKYINILA